jgi:peroxiredoxin
MAWRIPFQGQGPFWRHIFSSLLLLSLLQPGCGKEAAPPLKIGDAAPSFTVQTLDGKAISLSDYQGSPVVLRFFLTDCKFCRADTPVLNQLYSRFAGKGLRVLYIDPLGIDQHTLTAFARELQIKFPVARDEDGKAAASYRVKALPQTIVLSPDHKIIAAILGGLSEPELDRLLLPYFQ